jgi:hypothetical protein
VLEHDLQGGKVAAKRRQHPFQKHGLPIEDVDLGSVTSP